MKTAQLPKTITFVRHAHSTQNERSTRLKATPEFQAFKTLFDAEIQLNNPTWQPSPELHKLAASFITDYHVPEFSDHAVELTELGHSQAASTGKTLAASQNTQLPDVIFVSPYRRTQDTFNGIKRHWPTLNEVPTITDQRIKEISAGIFSNYTNHRIYLTLNPHHAVTYQQTDRFVYQPPNGQSITEFFNQVEKFVKFIKNNYAGKNIWIVSHGATIVAIRKHLEGWTPEQYYHATEDNKTLNCSFTTYKSNDNDWEIQSYNKIFYENLL